MGIDPENSSQFEELIEVVKMGIDPEIQVSLRIGIRPENSSQFEEGI